MILPAGMSGRPGFGTMILPPGMGAYRRGRGRGLGQNPFTDAWSALVSAAENVAGGLPINAPSAGGGSGIDSSGNPVYVNASGQDQSTPDPTAGQTPSSLLPSLPTLPTIPTWVPWTIGIVGVLLLLGYSGLGKTAAAVVSHNPLLSVFGNPPHRRRHRNRRRNRASRRSRR